MKVFRTAVTGLVLSVFALTFAQEPTAQITLRFVSLAWQEQAIASVKQIVAAWNTANPDVQVEYQQVDWGSINDYLVTSFETQAVPDVFHFESTQIKDFGSRGYLTDLGPLVSEDLTADVAEGAWATVTGEGGERWGIPFLWESRIVLYNRALLQEAGIEAPSVSDPWTWDEYRDASLELTKDTDGDGDIDQWGSAIGLSSPVNFVLNLSVGFGAQYFYEEDGAWVLRVGDAEKEFLNLMMEMLYENPSVAQDGLGLSGPELFPGFFEGRYAMLPGIGVWARQQIAESGPEDFGWGVLPPLEAETQNQGSSTQTLSIPAASPNQAAALEFTEFFLNAQNMATLAQGDWLFPTRTSSFARPEFQTEAAGWNIATESAKYLTMANWQNVPNFEEFSSRVAKPIFQELFANRITVDEAAQRLEQEGNRVLGR